MRRTRFIVAALALFAAVPVSATQSLECRSPGRGGVELYVSVGSGGGIDLVTIVQGRQEIRATGLPGAEPRIASGSLDPDGRLSVRTVSGDGGNLLASVHGTARAVVLRYRGRSWRLSCRWERQD